MQITFPLKNDPRSHSTSAAPVLGSPTGERDLLCRLDESSLPRAGTCCQKCLSCWKYILASLAAVSGNPQNQTEKSCSRSSFLEHLRRLIIRLSGECVRFRLILRIPSYCCLTQRLHFQQDRCFSQPVTAPGKRPPFYTSPPLLSMTLLYHLNDFFFFLSSVPFPLLSLST